VRFLGKISVSVLVIWVVVGVSILTLYPIAQNPSDQQLGIDSRNLQPEIDSNNSQSGDDSSNLQPLYSLSRFFGNSQSAGDYVNTSSDSGNTGIGSENTDNDSGNKYLVDNFLLNLLNFTAEITNQHNRVTEDGFYEIKNNSKANHQDVLQNGTFTHSTGTFTITNSLKFTPVNNTKYHILVYTNYPAHDNRVSKDDYDYYS
jgi:hypothetical protein